MGAEKCGRFWPDPRTWLLLCLLGIAAILVIRSEIGCLCLFLACLLIHLLAGNGGKILPYGLYYLIFYGIGWLGVQLMDSGCLLYTSITRLDRDRLWMKKSFAGYGPWNRCI